MCNSKNFRFRKENIQNWMYLEISNSENPKYLDPQSGKLR